MQQQCHHQRLLLQAGLTETSWIGCAQIAGPMFVIDGRPSGSMPARQMCIEQSILTGRWVVRPMKPISMN
ncbi:hypothetical protein D8Y22_20180 [Salinadaptatus halalkaliphilus]|uniref:Uncharacterized protein n=1 Tax=Salinadaptatus halalkaliphilus TaxID=2419781 RepID=A0A4S3TGT2_9EURY|nr:hypothetical protein D8Y22_20180 [Salinadaptatus halalkaliphilus]